jgi:hypothetical protein
MDRFLSLRDRYAHHVTITIALMLVVSPIGGGTPAQALSTYHVGNSLTGDSRVLPWRGGYQSANAAGLVWQTGWHIDCGDGLGSIVAHPTENCVDPPPEGIWPDALPNFWWDAITLQPFDSDNTTLQLELDAAKTLIQTANTDLVYIYESWPDNQTGSTIEQLWNAPVTTHPTDLFQRNAAHLDWIFDQLVADPDLSGVTFQVIPAVDALIEVEQEILAGNIPGLTTTEQLYRDYIHMNNLGRYVAANTVIASLFGQSTQGFPFNNDFLMSGGTGPVPITPETQQLVHEIIWDVVSHHADTGVVAGDLDGDGFVGIADLNVVLGLWNQTVPITTPADVNGDGFIGIEDLNEVLGNWNAGTPPVTTPEPATLCFSVLVLGICLRPVRRSTKACMFTVLPCVLLLSVSSTAYSAPIQVFLMAGQSNMSGNANAVNLPIDLQSPLPAVRYNYHIGNPTTVSTGWEDLSPWVRNSAYGPEMGFGHRLNSDVPDPVALLKHAHGGTSLERDWNPAAPPEGSQLYPLFINHVTNALPLLGTAGVDYEVAGMFWQQGEADQNISRAPFYEDNLNNFIASVRSDLGLPDLRFYIGALHEDAALQNLDTLRQAQMDVAAADPNAYFVETSHLTLKLDLIHFNSTGQVGLGEAYADAYLRASNPADRDLDGFVGIEDMNIILGEWNQQVAPDSHSDPSGDGFVGIADLNVVLGNWNAGTPPLAEASAVVPEPGSLLLLGLGAISLVTRIRGHW